MKTIQFILSLLMIAFLASCSADSDLLNDMGNANLSQKEEPVSITLNLMTEGVKTRGIETGTAKPEGNEDGINSYAILVFGDNDILLHKSVVEANSSSPSVTIEKIKKQTLRVYAIANFNKTAVESIVLKNPSALNNYCSTYWRDAIGDTPAVNLPKAGSKTVLKNDLSDEAIISVTLTQLTARLDKPEIIVEDGNDGVIEGGFTFTSAILSFNGESESVRDFPYYFYPEANTRIAVTGNFKEIEQSYQLGSWQLGGENHICQPNTIYQLNITTKVPEVGGKPAALWIDWYIVAMIKEDISVEVGGDN